MAIQMSRKTRGNPDAPDEAEERIDPSKDPIGFLMDRGRISSEPPPWAVLLAAGAFFSIPVVFSVLPELTYIAYPVLGPMTVVALAMLANKLMQAKRAADWPQAVGRITRSEVAAQYRQKIDGPTELVNIPAVTYTFVVAGKTFTGTCISVGEDSGGANTETTLAHYPLGASVKVFDDPRHPDNCVLERDVPKELPKGCAMIVAIVVALCLGGYWLATYFAKYVGPYMQDGHGKFVVIAAGAGVLALLVFQASRSSAKAGIGWPKISGTVIDSTIERYVTRDGNKAAAYYTPVVEYAYTVNNHEYRSRQIQFSNVISNQSAATASKIAARYPKDSAVEVHYDPGNPGNAVLERPAQQAWFTLAVALACFAAAAYAAATR